MKFNSDKRKQSGWGNKSVYITSQLLNVVSIKI